MYNATDIKKAIAVLASKIDADTTPDGALKFTQAALNLAHALEKLKIIENMRHSAPDRPEETF